MDERGRLYISYHHVQFLSQVLSEKLFPELTGQERDFALMKYLLKTLWSDSPRQFYRDVATHFGRDAVRFLAFADVFDDIQTLMYFKPEAFGIVDEKAQRRLRRSLIAEYERKNRSIK